MQKHLSSSCVRWGSVFVSCSHTRGAISHQICFIWDNDWWWSGAGCGVRLIQWAPSHHCECYYSTQINQFYYFWHIIISSDPFFHLLTLKSREECYSVSDLFTSWARQGSSNSWARVMWPAQTEAAGAEKLKPNTSRLIASWGGQALDFCKVLRDYFFVKDSIRIYIWTKPIPLFLRAQ